MGLQIFDAAHYHGLDNIPLDYSTPFSPSGALKINVQQPTTLAAGEVITLSQSNVNGYTTVYSLSATGTPYIPSSPRVMSTSLYSPAGELLISSTPSSTNAFMYLGNTALQPISILAMLGGTDVILGNSFDNRLMGYGGGNWIDGNGRIDTAYYFGSASRYSVTRNGDVVNVSSTTAGVDALINVERICFASSSYTALNNIGKSGQTYLALDIHGSAGQAYRLYQAAFDRKPDLAGLGSWMKWLDQGNPLQNAASFFQTTPEFASKYGTDVTHDQFVRLLYQNVLHRTPDLEGYLGWMGILNLGQQSRAEVLVGFSESPEHQAALIGVMQNGMQYIPPI